MIVIIYIPISFYSLLLTGANMYCLSGSLDLLQNFPARENYAPFGNRRYYNTCYSFELYSPTVLEKFFFIVNTKVSKQLLKLNR